MKARSYLIPAGVALLAGLALVVPARSVRAEETVSAPRAHVAGVVSTATETTLQIRPPIGTEVTLTVDGRTRILPAGQDGDGPEAVITAAAARAALSSFGGLYAWAEYDRSSLVALTVRLAPPGPLPAFGRIRGVGSSGFSLELPEGRRLDLVVGNTTEILLDGRAVAIDQLADGDLAEVTFLLAPTENRALGVHARSAPPQVFEGVVAPSVMASSVPVVGSFSATHGDQTLVFQVTSETAIRVDGQPAPISALVVGQPVRVLYRKRGDVNLALRVSAGKLSVETEKREPAGSGGDGSTAKPGDTPPSHEGRKPDGEGAGNPAGETANKAKEEQARKAAEKAKEEQALKDARKVKEAQARKDAQVVKEEQARIAKEEQARKAALRAKEEAERKAAQKVKAEAKRQAAEAAKAEAKRKAAEKAAARAEEAKRKAAEKAEKEAARKAAQKAKEEAKRQAAEQRKAAKPKKDEGPGSEGGARPPDVQATSVR